MTIDAYIPRERLPETYGEGERQYDMAMSALGAAEAIGWPLALISGSLAWRLWGPWIAVPVALLVYFIAIHPYKKALKKASALWVQDNAAYQALFKKSGTDTV